MTSQDIVAAITELGVELSVNNPANFIKDVIRGSGASGMWPEKLKNLRITGRQVTGAGNVFEFVDYELAQTEPFPNRYVYDPTIPCHKIQSVSMPLATKDLGRDDETYLIQVAAKLLVVETHFAILSKIEVIELSHLQIGIKLRLCEVDSLYAAWYKDGAGNRQRMVITVEAKKRGQRILEEQIVQQVRAAFNETKVDLVVPIAMTVIDLPTGQAGIYVLEFHAVERSELPTFDAIRFETQGVYELVPPVPGI